MIDSERSKSQVSINSGWSDKQYKSMHDREHLISQFVYYFFTTDEKNEDGVTETAAQPT